MKQSSLLSAAVVAAGVALLAPTDAKACEHCAELNDHAMCASGRADGFGGCEPVLEYDCDGNLIHDDCRVWFDSSCMTSNYNWGTQPMWAQDFMCMIWGCGS